MLMTRNVDLIIDCLSGAKDGKLSTIEIRDHLNSMTKYGTTSSELKSFMSRHRVFVRDGTTLVKRPCGCYKMDIWKLNRDIMTDVHEKQTNRILADFEELLVGDGWTRTESRFSSAVLGAKKFLSLRPE